MFIIPLERWTVRIGQGFGAQAARDQGPDREASEVAVNEVVVMPSFILDQQIGEFAVANGAAWVQITRCPVVRSVTRPVFPSAVRRRML